MKSTIHKLRTAFVYVYALLSYLFLSSSFQRSLQVEAFVPPSRIILIPFISSTTIVSSNSEIQSNNNHCIQQEDSPKRQTVLFSSTSNSNNNNNPSISTDSNTMSTSPPRWYQKQISITAPSRGCHLITPTILSSIQSELSTINIGMANLFIQHTSASLTINENADPDVRRDLEMALNKIVPKEWNHDGTFHHTMEGDDDMPGHVKSSLIGPSLNIPIRNGRLALGTWQGIYLNEHRDQGGWGGGHTRNIIITLQGQGK